MADEFVSKYGHDYNHLKRQEMMDFIAEKHPDKKEWFKQIAFEDKNGNKLEKYNHLNAKKKFCKEYAPSLLPKKKAKGKDVFADW